MKRVDPVEAQRKKERSTPIKKSDTPIREEAVNPFSSKSPLSESLSNESRPPMVGGIVTPNTEFRHPVVNELLNKSPDNS